MKEREPAKTTKDGNKFEPDEPTAHAIRHFAYLKARWDDEYGYEEFAEYRKSMRANLPPGSSMGRMTDRPFKVELKYGNHKFTMRAEGNRVTTTRTDWKSITRIEGI